MPSRKIGHSMLFSPSVSPRCGSTSIGDSPRAPLPHAGPVERLQPAPSVTSKTTLSDTRDFTTDQGSKRHAKVSRSLRRAPRFAVDNPALTTVAPDAPAPSRRQARASPVQFWLDAPRLDPWSRAPHTSIGEAVAPPRTVGNCELTHGCAR